MSASFHLRIQPKPVYLLDFPVWLGFEFYQDNENYDDKEEGANQRGWKHNLFLWCGIFHGLMLENDLPIWLAILFFCNSFSLSIYVWYFCKPQGHRMDQLSPRPRPFHALGPRRWASLRQLVPLNSAPNSRRRPNPMTSLHPFFLSYDVYLHTPTCFSMLPYFQLWPPKYKAPPLLYVGRNFKDLGGGFIFGRGFVFGGETHDLWDKKIKGIQYNMKIHWIHLMNLYRFAKIWAISRTLGGAFYFGGFVRGLGYGCIEIRETETRSWDPCFYP